MGELAPGVALPTAVHGIAVRGIRYCTKERGGGVSAAVTWPQKSDELFYACDEFDLVPRPEAFVCALLMHAMGAGDTLHIEGSVSARLTGALETIQDIYISWEPSLNRVRLASENLSTYASGNGAGTRVAAFFSGGVDSFYTLLKHQEEIDVLVFVHGFDVRLDDHALRAAISGRLSEVAREFKKELIQVETNVRELIDQPRLTKNFHNWEILHGAVLASVAHVLPPDITKVYVPATHSYRKIYPWGSHPLLDPLWSTEDRQLVHDGCEASRLQKCGLLATSDLALATVRVCWENPGSEYNCGRCEKCQRTMLGLLLAGALDRCSSFNVPLDPRRVARRKIKRPNIQRHYTEMLAGLRNAPEHSAFAKAVQTALKPPSLIRRRTEALLKSGWGIYKRARAGAARNARER